MRLSIIVPVYNVKNYIRECLDSIVSALYTCGGSVEVIVVDDGSTDGCSDIVDEYKTLEWFNVIHQENAGVAAARNKGLSAATGDWIWLVDSDDWIEACSIRDIIASIIAYPDADMIMFDGYENRDGSETLWEHFDKQITWSGRDELSALWCGTLYYPMCHTKLGVTNRPLAAPWDKVYRRQFLNDSRIHFCQELRVLDDMVFNMEVCGLAKCIAYVKKPIYHYRIVGESITHSYKADRLGMDMAVWEYIDRYIDKCTNIWDRDVTGLRQAFYLRIVKSYGICCMQQFFNKNNKMGIGKKIACARKALGLPMYREAFDNADMRMAEAKLRPLIIAGRMRLGVAMWLLAIGQRIVG